MVRLRPAEPATFRAIPGTLGEVRGRRYIESRPASAAIPTRSGHWPDTSGPLLADCRARDPVVPSRVIDSRPRGEAPPFRRDRGSNQHGVDALRRPHLTRPAAPGHT